MSTPSYTVSAWVHGDKNLEKVTNLLDSLGIQWDIEKIMYGEADSE